MPDILMTQIPVPILTPSNRDPLGTLPKYSGPQFPYLENEVGGLYLESSLFALKPYSFLKDFMSPCLPYNGRSPHTACTGIFSFCSG